MATHGLPTWPWTDAETEELPAAEALLLDAMRCWDQAARAGEPPLPTSRWPLVTADAAAAAVALDAVLRAGGGRRFALGRRAAPRLTGQEPALLLAFALAQRGPRREALAAFLRLLPANEAQAALGNAVSLGAELRRVGLLLGHPLRA
jgi:hypothetical protein